MTRLIGEIVSYAGTSAPYGWLLCDGSTVDIVSYRLLYQVIGTQYGGNGTTTFGLPDLGGRSIIAAYGDVYGETIPAFSGERGLATALSRLIVPGSTVALAAGQRLVAICVNQAVSARTISVGTTVSGTDIVDSEVIPTNTDYDIDLGIYTSVGITLHFSGFTGTVRVFIS